MVEQCFRKAKVVGSSPTIGSTFLRFFSSSCIGSIILICMKITCENCGIMVEKTAGEVNRSRRLGRPMFCSLACGAKHQSKVHPVRESNVTEYNTHPNVCKSCGKNLPYEKRRNNYCNQSCSAAANNRHRNAVITKTVHTCLSCGCEFEGASDRKYCSSVCSTNHRQKLIFDRIVSGDMTLDERHYRKYLIISRGCKCEECGWDKVNPKTGKCPIQMDHVDGNAENHSISNLRLLCPNCHALTPTFGNLNKGRGRAIRRSRYRKRFSNL